MGDAIQETIEPETKGDVKESSNCTGGDVQKTVENENVDKVETKSPTESMMSSPRVEEQKDAVANEIKDDTASMTKSEGEIEAVSQQSLALNEDNVDLQEGHDTVTTEKVETEPKTTVEPETDLKDAKDAKDVKDQEPHVKNTEAKSKVFTEVEPNRIRVSSSSIKPPEKELVRNQSDILPSLRELTFGEQDSSMMLFSNKGCPTKKYYRRREISSADSEKVVPISETEKETPPITPIITSSTNSTSVPNGPEGRNVLTGLGLNSKDEYKAKSAKRKDGNPVLGLGYDDPVVTSSTTRVPPGGFSNGLW